MGKKKFIDKKKSATFCLLARDSSDPIYAEEPENDRVFVRVDNNPVSIKGMNEDEYDDSHENDPNSIFADSLDDVDYCDGFSGHPEGVAQSTSLPDRVRREILELGFPDDGYNYLTHLREIRNTGGGSAFFENPKANLRDVPDDVKAYDASRVRVAQASKDTNPITLYKVAEKTVNVRVQKAVDPDIAKLLDEAESEINSDVDDLEEDFVVKANILEEALDVLSETSLASISDPQDEDLLNESNSVISHGTFDRLTTKLLGDDSVGFTEKPRGQRLLDQQFDLLVCQEYGTDNDEDDGLIAKEDVSLAGKLNNALNGRELDELDENYRAPGDISQGKEDLEIVRRCVEYAEKYENEDEDNNEVVIEEESSDESENFDCETIVSTFSNLDNHPGKINAPEIARKKRLAKTISEALKTGTGNMISLGGKDKLPVDYLPNGRKTTQEKAKPVAKIEPLKRKPHGEESKEEKKERKAAVKEEKRDARRVKKELKGVYRGEATRAQKVVADSGPSSIHLT